MPSKRVTIFGYKLYLLVTPNGVILDPALAPANAAELRVGAELLAEHTDLVALGDKASISKPVAAASREQNRVELVTLPRRNQKRRAPEEVQRALNAARRVAETVNSQLAERFRVEANHARSLWGLTARLLTKLTAHTLCVSLNRLLGKPDVLRIKALAFPQPI